MIISTFLSSCAHKQKIPEEKIRGQRDKIFDELKEEEQRKEPAEKEEGITPEPAQPEESHYTPKGQKQSSKSLPEDITPRGSEGNIPFNEVGEGTITIHDKADECYRNAEGKALQRAVERHVQREMVYQWFNIEEQVGERNYAAVREFFHIVQREYFSFERVSEKPPVYEAGGDLARCEVEIRGTIYIQGFGHPGFEIIVDDRDLELGLNQPSYFDHSEVTVRFKLTRDAYIFILNRDTEGNFTLVYPNNYVPGNENRHRAGELFIYPSAKDKNEGLRLRAILPRDQEGNVSVSNALESLIIIASRNTQDLFSPQDTEMIRQGPFKLLKLKGMETVMNRLARLDREDWTMRWLAYEIKTRGTH